MSERIRNRNGFIELCRFIFVMCVVCHHALFLPDYGHIPFIGGYISVEFFFILSGFFLCKSALNGPYESGGMVEALKRLKTVYPYFFLSWIASFAISHMYNHNSISSYFRDFIRGIPQLLFLSMPGLGGGGYGLYDYVGTSWYLSSMFISILVVYPLIRRFSIEFASTISFFLSVMLYGNIIVNNSNLGVVNQWTGFCQYGILRAIAGMCLGCFCYFVSLEIKSRTNQLTVIGNVIFSTIQILIVLCILYLMDDYDYSGFEDIIQVFLFSALIIISFSHSTILNNMCSNKAFYWLGKFSAVVFVTQSVTYMYPILKYPGEWRWRFLYHIMYVLAFSIVNYFIVGVILKFFREFKINELLFSSEK